MILFYQRKLSPLKRQSCCIYIPTCSEYTRQAVEKYGAVKGCILGFIRILKCNPFCKGGYDPLK